MELLCGLILCGLLFLVGVWLIASAVDGFDGFFRR